MPIDYKDLLLRYIDHVGEAEGSTFLEDHHKTRVVFTAEEMIELRRLNEEGQRRAGYLPPINEVPSILRAKP